MIPAAMATVLGITPQADIPLIDTVADTLAGRRLLLIVDNCEHLLTAAGRRSRRSSATRATSGSSRRHARRSG